MTEDKEIVKDLKCLGPDEMMWKVTPKDNGNYDMEYIETYNIGEGGITRKKFESMQTLTMLLGTIMLKGLSPKDDRSELTPEKNGYKLSVRDISPGQVMGTMLGEIIVRRTTSEELSSKLKEVMEVLDELLDRVPIPLKAIPKGD